MAGQAPKKMGMSLYADLLEPDKQKAAGATISGAPVRYDVKADGDEEATKKKDASLKFQPIKRPQVNQKNNKPKGPTSTSSSTHKFSSSTATISASSPAKHMPASSTPQQQPNVQRSNFEDWVGDEDDDEFYYQDNRQRGGGGRRKKKNKKGGQAQDNRPAWDWDDIYDPSMPNSYADYKGSEEQFREIRDWKARLYYHMRDSKKQKNGRAESEEEKERVRPINMIFAPPTNLNFAPPSSDNDARPPSRPADEDDDHYPPPADSARRDSDNYEPPASFAPHAVTSRDATGEDAYMRRMRMSGMAQAQPSPPPPPRPAPAEIATSQSPQPPAPKSDVDLDAKRAEAQAKIAAFKAKLQKSKQEAAPAAPPVTAPMPMAPEEIAPVQSSQSEIPPPPPEPVQEPGSTISRAPVRYDVPAPQQDSTVIQEPDYQDTNSSTEADQPKSNRPGQKGFAERLLAKYGWEKGQGLGASGEGITTALVGKADKRKKLSDKEGGGWAQPANMGKIVGGKRRKVDTSSSDTPAGDDDAKYGKMSSVIKLEGMLDGLDVQKEIEENNLMQEVGDEMGKNYGNVERVFIWRKEMGGDDAVFVKFNSQLSALRAVQGMDGVTFADNEVKAGFWDGDDFEKGVYG